MSTEKILAHFTIFDVFRITGRGLVLAGVLRDGKFEIGDQVTFAYEDLNYSYRIDSIEFMRRGEPWHTEKVALLIRSIDEEEQIRLRELLKGEIPALIYTGSNKE
jgi:translation elongation factor EF-Tu-like GTPase